MKTAICIASGPSLNREDVEYCRGKGRVYAIKEAALMAPWADVLYAADTDWWDKNPERWADFKGEKRTVSKAAADRHGLIYLEAKTQLKWSTTPGALATGGNSGFQALNMAVLDGAERVILLGYDYGHQPGMSKHWWDVDHPRDSRYSNYAEWNRRLAAAAPLIPVPVLNATGNTAITCFPLVNLREVL
jgi:hypothetical protein